MVVAHHLVITIALTPVASTATTVRSIWDLAILMGCPLATTMDGLITQDTLPIMVGVMTPFTVHGIHGAGTDLMAVFTVDTTTAITTVSMTDSIMATTTITITLMETIVRAEATAIAETMPVEAPLAEQPEETMAKPPEVQVMLHHVPTAAETAEQR